MRIPGYRMRVRNAYTINLIVFRSAIVVNASRKISLRCSPSLWNNHLSVGAAVRQAKTNAKYMRGWRQSLSCILYHTHVTKKSDFLVQKDIHTQNNYT